MGNLAVNRGLAATFGLDGAALLAVLMEAGVGKEWTPIRLEDIASASGFWTVKQVRRVVDMLVQSGAIERRYESGGNDRKPADIRLTKPGCPFGQPEKSPAAQQRATGNSEEELPEFVLGAPETAEESACPFGQPATLFPSQPSPSLPLNNPLCTPALPSPKVDHDPGFPPKVLPPKPKSRFTDAEHAERFGIFDAAYPARSGGTNRTEARLRLRRLLEAGKDFDAILAGVHRYRAWCDAEGKTGTELVRQMTTFLGKNPGWLEDWSISGSKPQPERWNGRGLRPGQTLEQSKQELMAMAREAGRRE